MNEGSRDTDAGPDSPSNATPNGLPGPRAVDFDPDDDREPGFGSTGGAVTVRGEGRAGAASGPATNGGARRHG